MGMEAQGQDRYRRLERLGQGASGQVWLVEDSLREGSRFALKEPVEPSAANEDLLVREFVLLARLRHPGLVEVFDLDRSPSTGGPRFTLEFVEGEPVAQTLSREGPASLPEIAGEALGVLAFLHDFGLIHRDLKPSNLLLRARPRVGCRLVLLDLGLAAVTGTGEGNSMQAAGPAPGTLPYLAPELFEGAPPTRCSDLYALGALLHEVLYGSPPFLSERGDLSRFIEAVRSGRRPRLPPPRGCPRGLVTWIDELLAPDPGNRPAGAREALARLNGACDLALAEETTANRAARLASDPPPARSADSRELLSLLEAPGGPRLIWLTGPAGSGKSRMLRWLRTEAILRRWSVFLVPPPLLPTPADDVAAGVGTLLRQLREETRAHPTLLLVDDIEGADGQMALLLDRVGREVGAPPVRVVAALRPGEAIHPTLRRLVADTGSVPTLHSVELGPIDAEDIRAMIQRATGGSAVSEARLRWLAGASEGNPLLAEALLVEDAWARGGGGARSSTLERSVAARLNLLSAPARSWLEALAALGPDVAAAVVATLAELPEPQATEAGEEVRMAGLARVHRARWSPESRWVCAQVLLSIDEARRVGIHARAAELLLGSGESESDPWRLARLWSEARSHDNAVECARRAALQSERAGDPAQAAERWAYALRHLPRRDVRRRGLRVRQAQALATAGRYEAAARAFGAALRPRPASAERWDLQARQAQALVHAGRFARAREVADEVLAAATGAGSRRARGRALQAVGLVLGRLGRDGDALPYFEEALSISREEGDPATEAETLQSLATCKDRQRREDAEADFVHAIELFRKLGRQGSELKSLVGLSMIRMRAGKLDQAQALLEEVRLKSVEHGNLDLLETALSKLASVAIEQGRLDAALALGREALDQARHLGDTNRVLVDRCRVAEALIGCGRPAEAADLLREALKAPPAQVEPDSLDNARMLLADALLEVPGTDEANIALLLELGREGFRQRRNVRALLMSLAIEMERRSRPAGRAEPFEPLALEYDALAQKGGREPEPEIRLRAELARASWLLETGNPAAARESANAAAELARRSGHSSHAARAMALVGLSLERLGDGEPALKALREGAALLDAAVRRITDPALRASFLDRPMFRTLRRPETRLPSATDRRLLALYEMIRALNSESDPDALLDSILDMALGTVSAQRGMILLRDPAGGQFSVRVARNVEKETEQDAEGFSRSIAAQAGAGRSILALDAGRDERFRDLRSVGLYGIRSLICVPLRSRGRIIGTVYLDSRRKGSLFSQDDLRFLEAFADHAALALENARERAELLLENRRLQSMAEARVHFGNLVGRSAGMQHVFGLIEKVAASNLPVLIQGESGTGKELVARAIHFHGPRRRRIFLSENCSAIPETLLESELFGHVRGAFTGAERDRRGLFEQADGGTLFLDEVGDMSASMQARLLRVLQEGEVRRVGGDRVIRVDVRIVAATHRELVREVEEGRFREDLFYRLQVLLIRIPPLRERKDDISLLIDHSLNRIGLERGRSAPKLDTEARDLLECYDWPGNVRQLENTLQRLVLLAGERPIGLAALGSDEAFRKTLREREPAGSPTFSLERGAREQLRRALDAAGGNRERAAKLLGVSRATIYRKIKDLGLTE